MCGKPGTGGGGDDANEPHAWSLKDDTSGAKCNTRDMR